MGSNRQQSFQCPICKKQRPVSDGMYGELIDDPIAEIIRKTHPGWPERGITCLSCLDHYGSKLAQDTLEASKGDLSDLEDEVVKSLEEHQVLSKNVNVEFDRGLTLKERVADKVAEFGGSWTFIGIYVAVLMAWIGVNSVGWFLRPFDPYPYIFLNLVLSAVAAMQAPVILMSQNRQDAKDRLRSEHDYRVNLKAELEIRQLSAKMDKLLTKQWSTLLKMQQTQIELLKNSICKDQDQSGN
jgi:uncharacterized membrane protein